MGLQNDIKYVNWHQLAHDGTNEDQEDSHTAEFYAS